MKRNKCCILFNQPRIDALPDELDVLDQVEYIEKNLNDLGIITFRKGITLDFMYEIAALASDPPDFVFNLVESINNKGELCYFVPALLNMYSIPYSGNPVEAMFITTSKALTSKTLKKAGINNPGGYSPSEYNKLIPGNRYIIKPVWEDGSLGITGESVFTYVPGYEKKLKEYKDTHWLIEDFIDGREFNISVLASKNGPEVMPAAEMVFYNFDEDKPKIVDFKAKWEEGSFEYENTIRNFPGDKLNPVLKERIESAALQCWHVFGLKGYARVDMRIDRNNIPYVIEVNANPCMSPDSGLVAATRAASLPFGVVLQRIIDDLND
ncbi:MAG TPA: ATP-grasp domain-containing protein [Bacteroidales bacterium]|jgi:D-alanine-D-alanine ligase|nr:ATP-grasp domain-containing protein [Bacteroidales bacterium]OQB65661.1 MAG: D-alanine--D-alanine ligase [Bacteroidetes bacterium ADurb.Bin145]HOU02636.1 ATP-grasp domain-containing protein [Bacteroidales bacterium]HQG62170.1 ATP-grasp domain-containing protein [Bacteroidales bacterium]HQK67488.1 ATP-grasp domain-containing protein [Bacteroidales bacterium]